jgi:hypothetical protein
MSLIKQIDKELGLQEEWLDSEVSDEVPKDLNEMMEDMAVLSRKKTQYKKKLKKNLELKSMNYKFLHTVKENRS